MVVKCINPDCNKRPNFNYINETKGIYCNQHKLNDMIDVNNKKCISPDCNKQPKYNYINETKGIYCKEHKLVDMINVTSKKCINSDCNKIPYYNYNNETKGLYCNQHKLDDMIDIKNKKCNNPDCNKQPVYNHTNEKKGLYCKEHKLVDMVDVGNKRCKNPDCNKIPSYNYSNETKGLYCNQHKLNDMVDVISKKCISPDCNKQVQLKHYKGYCSTCFHIKYPDITYDRNNKTKERIVVNHIVKQFPDFKFIIDKAIGPKSHRPDMLLELDDRVIIIEIDENQHKGYKKNELLRLDIIQKAIDKKVVCIRFNPDSFIKDNIRTSSCFKLNDNKIFEVSKQDEFDDRLKHLYKFIKKYSSFYYKLKKHNVKTRKLYFDN